MGFQGKTQRVRCVTAVAAAMALSSSVAARALDPGSPLSPGLRPLAGSCAAPAVAPALSSAAGCVLGSNLASGRGEALDLTLGGQAGLHGLQIGRGPAAAGSGGPARSRSESRTAIVPGSGPGRLALLAETSEVLGPLTLLTGAGNQTTVELRGAWVLRVSADGQVGTVSYGPQGLADDQAAVVVRNAAGAA